MSPQLETYPNQLRRLIAGAVLAFGFDQGRFLRRQRAVECAGALSYLEQTHLYPVPQVASVHVHICSYRLARLQEYEPVPSVTNCKRARAQLSLSAGKTPVSALILSTLSLLPLAAKHPALSSPSFGL